MNFVITQTRTLHFTSDSFEDAKRWAIANLSQLDEPSTVTTQVTCEDTGDEEEL